MTYYHDRATDIRLKIEASTTIDDVGGCLRNIADLCDDMADTAKKAKASKDFVESADAVERFFFGTIELQMLLRVIQAPVVLKSLSLAHDAGMMAANAKHAKKNEDTKERANE